MVENLKRRFVSKNINKEFHERLTLGQKIADKVAMFGGSWPFIFLFFMVLLSWVTVNTLFLRNKGFDPYPYILLNLFLSMLAAVQAPIILMSQNRTAQKDRLMADHDFEVNKKSEEEIESLHAKLDALNDGKIDEINQKLDEIRRKI